MESLTSERRRTRRRGIPFTRSGVLSVGERSHIVAVADIGVDGAFLSGRVEAKVGEPLTLRVVLPRDGRDVSITCEVVWRSESYDETTGRPVGVAVRFRNVDAEIARRIEEFTGAGFLPSNEPVPVDHFEYRVVERADLDIDELNRMGLDGWEVTAVLPGATALRLLMLRRL
jgi:Tfp pilus assembly protein PilZ